VIFFPDSFLFLDAQSLQNRTLINGEITMPVIIGGRTRGAGVAAAPLLGSNIFVTGFLFYQKTSYIWYFSMLI